MGTGKGLVPHELVEPWTPEEATHRIRKMADGSDLRLGFNLCWTDHIKEQMKQYGLIMGDIIHVFKHGVVEEEGELSTRRGIFKYKMKCTTPSTEDKTVTVTLCVGEKQRDLKVHDIVVS